MQTVTGDENGPHLLHDCVQHRVGDPLQLRYQILQKHGHKVEHHLRPTHSDMTPAARHDMPIVLLVVIMHWNTLPCYAPCLQHATSVKMTATSICNLNQPQRSRTVGKPDGHARVTSRARSPKGASFRDARQLSTLNPGPVFLNPQASPRAPAARRAPPP